MPSNLKTTITKIKEPDFSKEVVIKELRATKETVDWHFNQMKKALGEKVSDQEIWQRINSLVLRDNVFNEAMKIIVPCYDIKIDPEDLKNVSEFVRKSNPGLANADEKLINIMAQRMIEKQMVFMQLAKEWNVVVTDEEAKTMLENYYKQTNNPIRDVLSNPKAMEGVKATIHEQKMADEICKKLKWKADWESIHKAAQVNNAQVVKEQEDKAKKEEKGDGTIVEK